MKVTKTKNNNCFKVRHLTDLGQTNQPPSPFRDEAKQFIMKNKILIVTFLIFNFSFLIHSHAQCDTIASVCAKHVISPYISDGQQYRTLLLADQTAEFHATFYGGGTYRIAACTGLKDGNLLFSLYDEDRNLLFSNKEFKNSPYWDFNVTSTMDIILEATLGGAQSGCAVVLIGFKQ